MTSVGELTAATPPIAIVSPSRELSEHFQQIAVEFNYSIHLAEKILEEGVQYARILEENGVDCIISRGPTGVLIKKNVSTPVVMVKITAFDILKALYQAQEYGKKIAFFEHSKRKHQYDFSLLLKILHSSKKIEIFYYHNQVSLKEKVHQAWKNGFDTAVATGECTLRFAREAGIQRGIMIHSSREALTEAFERAIDLVNLRREERKAADFANTVINHADSGIIVIDSDKKVTHFNSIAEKLLECKKEGMFGVHCNKLSRLPQEIKAFLLKDHEPAPRMLNLRDKKLFVHQFPLVNEGKVYGTMITLEEIGKIQKIEENIRKELYAKGLVARYSFQDIVCHSRKMKETIEKAISYAHSDSTVLINGESGTGKELFAHSIHQESHRSQGPFVTINCAAIPENLLESELFGYREGAFTGAKKGGKPGLFELAHRGTVFLDEISEMPLSLQTRLLRVLQEKTVHRLGDDKIIPIDVRIIASTNRNLPSLVNEGLFRQDLFFRLDVLSLHIPPLRERKQDLFPLMKHYLDKVNYINPEGFKAFQKHRQLLENYRWPGNAREVENFIEKFVTLCKNQRNPANTLPGLINDLYQFDRNYRSEEALNSSNSHLSIKPGTMEEMESQLIQEIMKLYPGENKSSLAKKLDISRSTLWKKAKSWED